MRISTQATVDTDGPTVTMIDSATDERFLIRFANPKGGTDALIEGAMTLEQLDTLIYTAQMAQRDWLGESCPGCGAAGYTPDVGGESATRCEWCKGSGKILPADLSAFNGEEPF